MVFVEIATINVTAPAIGSASDGDPPEKPDKPPLNLVVTITDKGYTLAASGGVLPGVAPAEGGEATGPTIPLKTAEVGCVRYVGTCLRRERSTVLNRYAQIPTRRRSFKFMTMRS